MEYLFRVCRPGGAAKLSLAASCLASVLWGTQVFAETPESEGNMMFRDESLMYEFVDVSVFQDPELLASGMVDSQMLFTGMMNSVDNFAENYHDLSQAWASPNDYSANQAYFA
mgnify:CR=1 FL=1